MCGEKGVWEGGVDVGKGMGSRVDSAANVIRKLRGVQRRGRREEGAKLPPFRSTKIAKGLLLCLTNARFIPSIHIKKARFCFHTVLKARS